MSLYTVEEIAERYKQMDDIELISFATTQVRTLREDALKCLKKELISRDIDTSILSILDSEYEYFEGLERTSLLQKIKGCTCPNCNVNSDLKAYKYTRIISGFITLKNYDYTKILCSSCGTKEKWSTIGLNFLLGWWSKIGALETPFTIILDLCNSFITQKISDRLLEKIVDDNTGHFRRNGTEKLAVQQMVNSYNNTNE